MNSNHRTNPLWTALVTPLTVEGEVAYEDLEHILREQESAGNGVVILGSTGEGLNLSEQQRRSIISFASSLDLQMPVVAGVGGYQLENQLEWMDFLETENLDGYLMVTPIYAKPGAKGQQHWFKSLMDRASRPCMLYNIPGRAGTSLNSRALEQLVDHPRFWTVKESSGSTEHFQQYQKILGDRPLYSGDDALLPDFAPYGAVGVVSVAGNAWPKAARLFSRLILNGEVDQQEIAFWKEASLALFSAPNPVPTKALLKEEKRITADTFRPPLHRDDLESMDKVLKASSDMQQWYERRLATV